MLSRLSTVVDNSLLILGQGDLGSRLAQSARVNLERSTVTWALSHRSNPDIIGDIAKFDFHQLGAFGTVVIILSPSERSSEAYNHLYNLGIGRLASMIKASRVIFISSTAVYPSDGQWHCENSQLVAKTYRAQALLEAERHIKYHYPNSHVILRLSGLINQQNHKKVGQPFDFKSKWLNMVSRSDVLEILIKLIEQDISIKDDKTVGTFNVTRSPIYNNEGQIFGKKVSNLKILSTLDFSFEEGYQRH